MRNALHFRAYSGILKPRAKTHTARRHRMTPEQSAEIIEAVRNHPEIGRGSCSYVDETMSDEEVLEELQEADLNTPA